MKTSKEYCEQCPNVEICNIKIIYGVFTYPSPCPGYSEQLGYWDFIRVDENDFVINAPPW